ncbi:hypothetical protein DC3_43630 [Deinococcus cellulosilyticus NBRC 106333 = KACC 11606]|uniref:Uncharacterized protein n=1 Tax=Deinococcus cellulosilyticus (strain DSM 18568 / NBRC 106333 / KACC 11606 / 5516J-15) TaxID=1223518 RepID=A0A511N8B7_DEIC1|nr:hypothetical protein DC3_43630 [Deinococcus cellulosilyticus NBRC 106333 = KACC 11606]
MFPVGHVDPVNEKFSDQFLEKSVKKLVFLGDRPNIPDIFWSPTEIQLIVKWWWFALGAEIRHTMTAQRCMQYAIYVNVSVKCRIT